MAARTIKRLVYGKRSALCRRRALPWSHLFLLGQHGTEFGGIRPAVSNYHSADQCCRPATRCCLLLTIGNLARLLSATIASHVPGSKLKASSRRPCSSDSQSCRSWWSFISPCSSSTAASTPGSTSRSKQGLDNALSLSRAALEMQMRDHLSSDRARIARAGTQTPRTAGSSSSKLSMLRRESRARANSRCTECNNQYLSRRVPRSIRVSTLPSLPPTDEVLLSDPAESPVR